MPKQADKNLFNRELSWLAFNERVLLQALSSDNPLLERVRFLAITANNLDEFFMVRVASIRDQVNANYQKPDDSGMTPKAQLKAILAQAHIFVQRQYEAYQQLLPELAAHRIRIMKCEELDKVQLAQVDEYFEKQVYPVLTPMAVDSSRPFPLLSNKNLYLGVMLETDSGWAFATVQVPSMLARLVPVSRNRCILLEDLIKRHINRLFAGWTILGCFAYRVTRNADLSIEEEEAHDLLREIEKSLKARKWGAAIRLEIESDADARLVYLLRHELELSREEIFFIEGPINLEAFGRLPSVTPSAKLCYKPFAPRVSSVFGKQDIFSAIAEHDILLHHPFDSFQPVVDFVLQAARDPNVLAIKQTLYRVSRQSPIVAALAEAAEAGKQVTVLLEVKARFDEENNIHWGRHLEEAGVHVIYGLMGLKTHSKITLVARLEDNAVKRYLHLGTGNYNDVTARVYTDMGLFTANPAFAADATAFFNVLSGYSALPEMNRLITAPFTLRERLLQLIARERDKARNGNAFIYAKMNALLDTEVAHALYEASQAGVHIRLLVRGICCLRPGMEGLSENIEVRSIVGRFLEHTRIYIFSGEDTPDVFLSSADWMSRNLDRRVELMFPVEDPALQLRIRSIMDLYWNDTKKSSRLLPDGSYVPCGESADPVNAQETLISKRRYSVY